MSSAEIAAVLTIIHVLVGAIAVFTVGVIFAEPARRSDYEDEESEEDNSNG